MLKNRNAIETHNETITTRLIVCNYKDYNKRRNGNGTETERKPERTRNGRGTQTETEEERNKGNKDNKVIKRKVFSPPSVEEVKEYISEKGYSVNANTFVDHYISNGWKVGSNKMKDWQSTVRNWARRENKPEEKTGAIKFDDNGIPHVT